ncbi:hypothetical protein L6164_014899 [Bauhinia variegata]|uniref:Uncharacterized protein n=1 Tax=Bauhinia variegata TaxID=167791 RepID=A0ACB9NKV9_BAUVA|nr:hypothetical protein L6164_014899 [Bauhinia variegata]
MDKFNFVRNGVTRLPPGFRFQPTDEELVFQYLKCKIFSCPLPASIIPDINVCKYDPWDFPGGSDEQGKYFFSYKETKYRNGNRMNRTTNSGYWKATGSDKKISSSRENDVVGMRKSLVFYQGKSPNGSRTEWVMHEYRLVSAENQNYANEIGDWVLCRIFLKKRSAENVDRPSIQTNERNLHVGVAQPRYFDFMMVHKTIPRSNLSPTSSSCSSSSSITEMSEYNETSGYTGL